MITTSEFEMMTTHVGLVDRSDRVRLDINGPDRAKFLHNLTTNEIKRMAVGRGCEAFVTSPQGKTIGYMIILAADDRIIARADPGGAELALPHFRKYGVFDDVSIDDVRSSTFELHLLGAEAIDLVTARRRPAARRDGIRSCRNRDRGEGRAPGTRVAGVAAGLDRDRRAGCGDVG